MIRINDPKDLISSSSQQIFECLCKNAKLSVESQRY